MEKIALSTYEVAAYWWIKCIKFKTRELCISGVRDKDEENFLDTFMHFGDVGYRKLYLDLVDSLKQDALLYRIENQKFNFFIQSTAKNEHDAINNGISFALDEMIPNIRLGSKNLGDYEILLNDEHVIENYMSISRELPREYDSCYILSGNTDELDFDNSLLATIFMLTRIDANFDSVKELRIGFCKQYNDDNNGRFDIRELHDRFNDFFNKAYEDGIISGNASGDNYSAYFYEADYGGLDNHIEKGIKYAEGIVNRDKRLSLNNGSF